MKKYIGIIGRQLDNKITFNQEIINVIYSYNMVPLGIIVNFNNKKINQIKPLLQKCSGFILQGGENYYDIDVLITKYLYDNDIPTLGICLGMQTMAVLFKGELGKIKKHYNTNHSIDIIKSSKLHEILNKDTIMVNSRHNDYVIKTNLDIGGYSDVIEAVEEKGKKFFLGVEWHPESLNDENSKLLFDSFFKSVSN